jgi:lipopolysaccharide assembly protein A
MKYLTWLLKAAIFFTLFAFALNNQQAVAVYFFFGTLWKAPLVLVVLAAFSMGLALGVLLMMPRWWKKYKKNQLTSAGHSAASAGAASPNAPVTLTDNPGISRHGL